MTVVIDPPLTVWYCDSCGEQIHRTREAAGPENKGFLPPEKTGLVAFENANRSKGVDKNAVPGKKLPEAYRVLHKNTCDLDPTDLTWETDSLMGTKGLQLWAEELWHGKDEEPISFAPGTSLTPALDLMFRFQVPYYEQARHYLDTQAAHRYLGGRFVLSDSEWQEIIELGSQEREDNY